MTNEITRIKEYIERRKKSAQTHIDSIHAFDLGPSDGVELRLSDIEFLIAKVESLAADAERLDFLAQNEAWIAWSKDGESCRVFVRNEDGEHLPIVGWVPEAWAHSARDAIDLAKEKA